MLRRTIMSFAVLTLFAGCGGSGPLDDASIRRLTNTKMRGADIAYPDGYLASLTPDDYELMRTLVSTLGPISSTSEATLDAYDYRLVITTGKDPVVIEVKLESDTQFRYRLGEYVYTGGNPTEFRDGVSAIRKRVEATRDE